MQSRQQSISGLCAALLFFCAPGAQARGTGDLQFLGTAFADLDQLIPGVLAACSRVAPDMNERLRDAYDELRTYHLPYQADVRDGAVRALSTSRDGQAMLAALRGQVQAQMAANYFPRDERMITRGYCSQQLPEFLRGRTPMLRFKDYADELREYGTFKAFLPPENGPR